MIAKLSADIPQAVANAMNMIVIAKTYEQDLT